ncbi:glutamyl-tRNA(Gln) amidotransferase, A subunit [Chthoniobacter flavus Ellin428]|uniref:Glutamyl-tRNA(Gln) amidotransferase subunit A n=1 Tax=Chthoniobacter flavus Ellin428 TaxID=497964 RepID=B4D3C4_9BACT|nr:Asp-tRNA(Asn)/Glu-tRNA(Gln) amidotransferase subunit GatA [Chthoniobacter flavus]EDY19235.1 glutamyl-tRNA(Gln) amidotransferase, A subunit [Chthoniobacter flavus Ellin428]TCO88078.1 aspartyl/glutamyl-tRNA(Asn/Gln) amidotransferase subunit A [Chthoniobacter flavus]
MELTSLSVAGLQQKLRAKEVSPADTVRALEARIAQVDPQIHGYLSRDFDAALKLAESADVSLPLGGVPIAIKDVINVTGEPCTAASKILLGYRSNYDATVIRKLRAAGAIPFGRTNLDEFAMGSSTENSAFGRTNNPWDTSRVPGGSSGGSAAVVASHEAFASLGSDTGGSIRQPAALCGCVGLKPTYGRVSRFGLIAFASSLDQIGPFTKTVRDAGLLLNVISGRDPQDSTSLDEPVPDYTAQLGRDLKGVRLGLPREYFIEGVDPQVDSAVRAAIKHYESLGAEIVDVSLPNTEHAVGVYYIIATAEASANLARFDGVRYGHRAPDPTGLLDQYGRTREEGFGPEVKRRIILGTYVLSSGYYDAYYLRAQKVRTLIRDDFTKAFEKCDAIVCPTSPEPAFKAGDRSDDPLKMYLADIFTIAANLAGICGISVPCGFANVDGRQLPIGLQILGKPFGEAQLLQIADAYEQSTDWHNAQPTLA